MSHNGIRFPPVSLISLLVQPMSITPLHSQSPGLELDHFFVAVSGLEAGSPAVEAAGFLASPSHPHPGQGTASRGILFENAYLEFIWLTDPAEAESPPIRRTRLSERVNPGSGACPFGIGLRMTGDGQSPVPFETWEYRPPYLPDGLSFQMSVNSENLGEPLVFVLPWLSGPSRPPSNHSNGARRVTELEIVMEGGVTESETLTEISGAGVASFRFGPEYFMDLELDGGQSGESLDLRPEIPLRIRW